MSIEHYGWRHRGVKLAICAGLLVWAALASPAQAQWNPATAGSQAWNSTGAINLDDFCDGTETSGNDTACLQAWVDYGHSHGKDLYGNITGTYYYSGIVYLYADTRIKCSSTSVVFKNRNNSNIFMMLDYDPWDDTPDVSVQIQDVRIENCGFDMNNASSNYRSFIFIRGNLLQAKEISIINNHMFDSSHPTDMRTSNSEQAQYVVLVNVSDVEVAGNDLSGGGRIKVGQPGKRLYIHDNTLVNINDNGITVVDTTQDSSAVSEDILIADNWIEEPIGSCIFFAADGESVGTSYMTTQRVAIRNNICLGDFTAAGITGVLPNHTNSIEIDGNYIEKIGASGSYVGGIVLTRADNSSNAVTDITVSGGEIYTDNSGEFNNIAGVYTHGNFSNLCVLSIILDDTTTSGSWSTAIWLNGGTITGDKYGNTLNNGAYATSGSVTMDTSGNTGNCYWSAF